MDKGTPQLIISEDGSHTLRVDELNEHYHSHKGALRESRHVFIQHGLKDLNRKNINLLEIGFGTGLNALLTALETNDARIHYHSLETLPLAWELVSQLNYPALIGEQAHPVFEAIHRAPWETASEILPSFLLTKFEVALQDFAPSLSYDLIYYDAFAPHAQPELWEPAIWQKLFGMMNNGGVLVTYCAKGQVKRDLRDAGFRIEALPGPPGKREMTRAHKP